MNVVKIKTSKPYDVVVCDSFVGLNEEIAEITGDGVAFIVYDNNTKKLFSEEISEELCDLPTIPLTVKEGEKCKTFAEYKRLTGLLAKYGADRTDVLISVGGGAVSDLVGFVAATYKRGIKHVIVPTTILSGVDASIGGKTAIDMPEGKNLVGAFYSPSLVFTNVSAFDTLGEKQVESGYGEIIKYAFIDKRVNKEVIARGDSEEIVSLCAEIKGEIVEKDEFEKGGREILNLGHTIGHALEAERGFSLSHGLCVAFGIDRIIDISADFYGFGEEKRREMKDLLRSFPFDFDVGEIDYKSLRNRILSDKKIEGDYIKFVLIKDIGDVRVERLPLTAVWKYVR